MFREMLLMFGLMLLMFQMISCEDQTCRLNKAEICYAALGHKLSLQMVPESRHYDARIQHLITGNRTVDPSCRIINDMMKKGKNCDLYMNRSNVMISNGAVIINHVIREDSGRYTLQLIDSIGSETHAELQVNVEAPIGSVKVSVNCSSGERRVFCSSDGDELIFSWTLNGLPQTEGNEIFVLDDKTSGNISCGVKNHVSRGEKSITLNYCTESTTVSVTSSLTNSTLVSTYGTSLSDSNLTSTQTPGELFSLLADSVPVVFVTVWILQMMILLFLLGGFHIYIRNTHTSGGKLEEETSL
ncbi:hypothetical protein E1301_Tti023462 [Triplophysa tibetana]|uniref:Ig-like domain-containing protein n=1 Tax=Triplophysa tibetana TaxID=1572043 RepID=A0A5A9NLM5_9TELE|nr:hypothetical protein E1301_Tti023462 [Triplophysa tibetana]